MMQRNSVKPVPFESLKNNNHGLQKQIQMIQTHNTNVLKTAAMVEIMKTGPMQGSAASVNASHSRGWASTFLSIWTARIAMNFTFLLSLWGATWLWPKNKNKQNNITTAVPLKTPPVWGMLRNLSWGRQEKEDKDHEWKKVPLKKKIKWCCNRTSNAEMESHFKRAHHPERGSFVACH